MRNRNWAGAEVTGDEEHFPLRQVLGSALLLTAQWCIHICWHLLCVLISLLNFLSKDNTTDEVKETVPKI